MQAVDLAVSQKDNCTSDTGRRELPKNPSQWHYLNRLIPKGSKPGHEPAKKQMFVSKPQANCRDWSEFPRLRFDNAKPIPWPLTTALIPR